jgi:MFS family permease
VLTDKVNRTRLLACSICLWAVATIASAGAPSFTFTLLLLARIMLGIVTAAAGPAVASLTGDYFPPAKRGRVWGWILSGEVVGVGLGVVISGNVASALGRRAAVGWAALPALLLAWAMLRLPEPRRSGGGKFYASVAAAGGAQQTPSPPAGSADAANSSADGLGLVDELAEQQHVRPYPELVLHSDPAWRSFWWAVRYVLRVRTNLVIIVASALAYFYLSGVNGFALLYAERHYRISQSAATLVMVAIGAGAVIGVLAGGRVSDRLLRRGRLNARVLVPMCALLGSVPFLALGFSSGSLLDAIPLLVTGVFFLGSANPPSDAARLDIIQPHLWGRSEGQDLPAHPAAGGGAGHVRLRLREPARRPRRDGARPGIRVRPVPRRGGLRRPGHPACPAHLSPRRGHRRPSIHAITAAAQRTGPPQAALRPA